MSLGALIILAISTAQPPMQVPTQQVEPRAEADRKPVRCRPAPYYVADTSPRPRTQRLFMTGSRVPVVRESPIRRARPCFLMRDGGASPPPAFRTAD